MAEAGPENKPLRRIGPRIGIAAGALVIILALWLIFSPGGDRKEHFTGYVVSDNLYLSSPVAGTVASLSVKRGQRVAAGAPLFRIDPTSLNARADEARAEINQSEALAQAQQADLARARADLIAAEAEADRAAADLSRYAAAQRDKPGSVAQQQVDQARASSISAARKRDAARTQVAAAQAQIGSARAQVAARRAGLTDAARQVTQLSPNAPVSGRIEDVMFQQGEWAAANAAIVSLVPDSQVKVRFYVPQAVVSHYRPGTKVGVACDGCASGMTATVDYIATRPEYTPPVIYSLDARQKLVFLVEAVPSSPRALVPGQPMDVTPAAGAGSSQ